MQTFRQFLEALDKLKGHYDDVTTSLSDPHKAEYTLRMLARQIKGLSFQSYVRVKVEDPRSPDKFHYEAVVTLITPSSLPIADSLVRQYLDLIKKQNSDVKVTGQKFTHSDRYRFVMIFPSKSGSASSSSSK